MFWIRLLWESNNSRASDQEISPFFWTTKVNFRFHKCLVVIPISHNYSNWVIRIYKYTMMCQTQKNFIMFTIVLGQHVSLLIESSSGPSKKTYPYLEMFKMRCGIPNAYILDKTVHKMHVSLCSYWTIRIPISKKWVIRSVLFEKLALCIRNFSSILIYGTTS